MPTPQEQVDAARAKMIEDMKKKLKEQRAKKGQGPYEPPKRIEGPTRVK